MRRNARRTSDYQYVPMRDYYFTLATPEDDEAIRRILRTNPMPGNVVLTYEREPNFFWGCDTLGPFWQVLVGRRRKNEEVVGFVCRATRPMWVNGKVIEVGYLSQLRVESRYQGAWLVQAGFQALRELHEDGRAQAYFATITEGNAIAEGVLVNHPRKHFPTFTPLGTLLTLALFTRQTPPRVPKTVTIEWASPEMGAELTAFYAAHSRAYSFYPVLQAEDIGAAITRGLDYRDIVVIRRNGAMVGAGALWDQSGYKQSVVQSYQGALTWAQPWVNRVSKWIGIPPLPAPTQPIPFGYGSFLLTAHHDPEVYRLILESLLYKAWTYGKSFLMVGMMAEDEYRTIAERLRHITYRSTLYFVAWQDGIHLCDQFTAAAMPHHVEIATL